MWGRGGRQAKGAAARINAERAEAALMEAYPQLVRIAFVALPPALGRHRRVLVAHGLVQRALPGPLGAALPGGDGPPGDTAGPGPKPEYAWVRERVLTACLAYGARPRRWPRRLPWPRALRPALPAVWGLRLFPRAGSGDTTSLDRALAAASAPARALFALCSLEDMPKEAARELLTRLGAPPDAAARRDAEQLLYLSARAAADLGNASEFDPCSVQTRPTDLLRRRRRRRLAGLTAALLALVTISVLPATSGDGFGGTPSAGDAISADLAPVMDTGRLVRAPGDRWADTSRVDFTAWAPRGARVDDTELLHRALAAWAHPAPGTEVTSAAATTEELPATPPALLYAGDIDGRAVVVLHDERRIVRYTEPSDGDGTAALDFARADDADVTTAAAVVVSRTARQVRFLTAPWIATAERRDLRRPDTPARSVRVARDGVTEPVARPKYGDCNARPALQLKSSARIVEHHTFVVADLGDLLPAHLTYMPLPGRERPRPPREATSTEALRAWAASACGMSGLRGGGVRSVSVWDFARQRLPEDGGHAVWSCRRADTWRGPGDIEVGLRRPEAAPDADATVVARDRDTAACSRFGQHVVASTRWRSPSKKWYLLAAGSRAVTGLEVTGDVRATTEEPTLARRAPKDARTQVTADFPEGEQLRPPGSE
ncbi:hypothetical protein [Streptomyces sp. NPDC042319]|uniref:hypothetical protein n=1 Tax=Streptomyces sp. NPDC042319 TaxID=3154332 RepID=UPI0033F45F7E